MVELLYLTFNRLEMTKVSWRTVADNTNWDLVSRLVVYDDGSTDGTGNWIKARAREVGVPWDMRKTALHSPPAIMCDYLARTEAAVFAKIDNDVAVPPGWLEAACDVLAENQELDLLGLAAGWTGVPASDGCEFGYLPCSHIGGVGLMRADAFRRYPDLYGSGRFGFTEWQHAHPVVSGWLTPDLPVVQLDLIPEQPWINLAHYYIAKKWARHWPPYAVESASWWEWLPGKVPA